MCHTINHYYQFNSYFNLINFVINFNVKLNFYILIIKQCILILIMSLGNP
jgi:hypothetical protein